MAQNQNPDFVAARVIDSSSIENFIGKVPAIEEKRNPTEDIAPANMAVRYRWKTYKNKDNSEGDLHEEKGIQFIQKESISQEPAFPEAVLPAEKKEAEPIPSSLLEDSVNTYDVQYNVLQKLDKSRDHYFVKKGELKKKNNIPPKVVPQMHMQDHEEEKNNSEEDDESQTTSLPYKVLTNTKPNWRKVTKEVPLPQVMNAKKNIEDIGPKEPPQIPMEFQVVPNLPQNPLKHPMISKEEEKVDIPPPMQNLVAPEASLSAELIPVSNDIPVGKKPSAKKLCAKLKQASEEGAHESPIKNYEQPHLQSNPANSQYPIHNNFPSPVLRKPRSIKLGLIESPIDEDPIDKIGSWLENIELLEKLKKLGVETEELKKHFAGSRLVFSRNERGLEGVISLAYLEQTLIGSSNSSLKSRLL